MTNISPATKKILALSMLQGVGPATLRKVAAEGLVFASFDELSQHIAPIARALVVPDAWEIAQELAEKQCDAAEQAGAYVISALDEMYPSLLSATRGDPFLLYVKGQLSQTPEKAVAIIGTRQPTKHGQLITRRITEFFTNQHWSVISGLALGCDALAHRAAIESNGHTVAVLAHGLHTIAPSQHRTLAREILESGGALVSEYRFGQGALPAQFVKRDRTQAGLAQGVVMIQSDLKGGSLHASRAILDYDRWLAVPFPTEADQASNEPKIQANILIADTAADLDRGILLKCHRSKLSKIIVLRARDDYPKMLSAIYNPRCVSASDPRGGNDKVHANETEAAFPKHDRLEPQRPPQEPGISNTSGLLDYEVLPGALLSETSQTGSVLQPPVDQKKATSSEQKPDSPKDHASRRSVKNESASTQEITVQHKLL